MIARFLLRRAAIGFAQLAVLVLAVFFLIRLMPADPVARFVGMNASPEAYAAAKANLGLDRSVLEQLAAYLGLTQKEGPGLLQGDLGRSWLTGNPVSDDVVTYLPITLELVIFAFIVALAFGVPLGLFGALRPGGAADRGTLLYGLFAGSQPEFTWGILFIFIFFVGLGIAPGPLGRLSPLTEPPPIVTGFITLDALIAGRFSTFVEALRYLALPVLTLAFVLSGPIIKMVRESAASALRADYILYARAAGLPPRVIAQDALRAALSPSMTLVGVLFGFMIGGAVLVENVFSLGGIGQYAVRSVLAFDYPAIQGVVLVISALSLFIYLCIDLAEAALDPRLRL